MNTCSICLKSFNSRFIFEGKLRNYYRRKVCSICLPLREYYPRKLRIIKGRPIKKRKEGATCLNCKAPCRRRAQTYCSNLCQQEFRRRDRIERNEASHISCKRFLIKENGYICSICSTKEWMGKVVPLILDHIDGNHLNNKLENLRLVCGNCDMQLPTYKGKNKGNGRADRRKRYAQGLSY